MVSPLEGGIKRTVARSFRKLFLDATLERDVSTPGAEPWDPPVTSTTEYSCKAIVDQYEERFRLEGTVQAGDRKVLVLADTLSTDPQANDRITIRSETFTVISVATDPAKATWELMARK